MTVLTGKQVVLGVTGCIAAYKAAELVRQIVRLGGQVQVIMTEHAREFVGPLTFQTLSANPVATGLFTLYEEREIGHIALAQRADLLVVAPATANCIGKVASGLADDMLSTVIMATRAPVLFAPAMNVHMWDNPVVQNNILTLKNMGYHIIDPAVGELACGEQGAGRLADPEDIVDAVAGILSPRDFAGRRAVVTAGPTREYIDPVRFISNPSTGKMGFALARALGHRGASVTLISGPTALTPPRAVACVPVMTAADMAAAVNQHAEQADIVIKSAAVADYRPVQAATQKIKKREALLALELERTPDILAMLGTRKGGRILVGFAAETEDMLAHAREKLKSKNLDMIVANDVSRQDVGFGSDLNQATILLSDGTVETLPVMSKDDLAHAILDKISLLQTRR